MTPSLTTLARRVLAEVAIPRGAVVLCAVSGGPDSIALLHVMTRVASRFGLVVRAHGVDHGLRPESSRELDLAAEVAASLDVRFTRSAVTVARGGNVQARARSARYAALDKAALACGAAWIATAHHADDRAETVLLRLLRGAGPSGLGVLPPVAELPGSSTAPASRRLVRPFVRARREAILAHIARHRLPFATDPSNDDPRYLRTRVRRELLPLLRALSPGIVDHLNALADQLGQRPGATTEFPLPRETQRALASLARSRSGTARVWLPGGLVVTLDPKARPGPKQRTEP